MAQGNGLDDAFQQHRVGAGEHGVRLVVQIHFILAGGILRHRGLGGDILDARGVRHLFEEIPIIIQLVEAIDLGGALPFATHRR